MSETHHRKLERMYLSEHVPINDYYRPQIEIGEARACVRIPVREAFYHAAGAVHGSVYFKALDDAAFFAASSLVPDVFLLTVSFNTYMTRPVTEGVLAATGTVVHRSRRMFVAEAVLENAGKIVGRGSGTFMRSRTQLTAAMGYA